ncbi:hypothetical protein NP233_g9781 [Leucocoprinus birnbaumii]|uniref:Integrase core domain-containing protein n=1 Tax=Leucocoprinus birnbaumii TaxID=56174 RepID=A0AAD5VQC4_9AGAR|nr:hypothetical protein NP233_g9781 [Leucocoprinus birnbaumii]
MPNPTGKNGSGEKDYPPDDILRTYFLELAVLPLTVAQKLDRLQSKYGLDIKKTKFFELQAKLQIPSIKKPQLSRQEIEDVVLGEVAKDVVHANGPRSVKDTLQDKLIFAPRDHIRTVMRAVAPEGFNLRFPGGRSKWVRRQPLQSIGPFREISADGHEKLNSQALKMGSLSLPIYGYRDKWSGMILQLCVLPDARKAAAIGHVYLDLVSKIGGVPIQVTTDKGSEMGWQISIQSTFREIYAPNVDTDIYPPVIQMKSFKNIVIESFWRWLHEKRGKNLKEYILFGQREHLFQEHSDDHHKLFYWIFVPLIQEVLDDFSTYWNQHCIRTQKAKLMPSGHIPRDAVENLDDMRAVLTEEVGSREENLGWFDTGFAELTERVYNEIGKPQICLENAWQIFVQMAAALARA